MLFIGRDGTPAMQCSVGEWFLQNVVVVALGASHPGLDGIGRTKKSAAWAGLSLDGHGEG